VLFDIRRKVGESQKKWPRPSQNATRLEPIAEIPGQPLTPRITKPAVEVVNARMPVFGETIEKIKLVQQDASAQSQVVRGICKEKDQKRSRKNIVKIPPPKPQKPRSKAPVQVRVREESTDSNSNALPVGPGPVVAKASIMAKPAIADAEPTSFTELGIIAKPSPISEPIDPTMAHSEVLLSLAQLNATKEGFVQENKDLAKTVN